MLSDLIERLRSPGRGAADAGLLVPAPPLAADELERDDTAGRNLEAIRETIDLLEADLTAVICAADGVRGGTQLTGEALAAIRARSDALATLARDATGGAVQLANATEEFAQSSAEIGRQVREAGSLTDQANQAASAAGSSVDGLKSSSTEIGNVASLDAAARQALDDKLAAIRNEHKEFVDRAMDTAAMISMALEEVVSEGKVTREALFDNDYVPIEGSNPQQHRTRFLDVLEDMLPPIQEPLLASDKRMVFCAAVDRNGYLPVHNRIYSQPQRPNDVAWNIVHCRNRRIFDDRAGLAAARNVRPTLIQNYPRDMGNSVIIMMTEIDAPIRVFGKHWGGFRSAYKT